ncbi:hypothetical protein ACFQV2_36700 [Actinokineospora soli]|uniref:Uncharacterized protein n=1 Tax=Actinokineospora soli TaxID=1048753 RepID=A0ABW2TXL6_9PSEU
MAPQAPRRGRAAARRLAARGLPASADSDLTDLANELIDRATAGEDIGGLIDSAITGAVEPTAPEPAEETAEPAPAEEEASSASGSTTSVPGVERENTTTWGGVDYGPDPGSSWGWAANRVEPVTAAAAAAAPPKVAPRSGTPPSPEKAVAPAPVRAPVAQAPAPVVRSVEAPRPAASAPRPPTSPPSGPPRPRPARPAPAPPPGRPTTAATPTAAPPASWPPATTRARRPAGGRSRTPRCSARPSRPRARPRRDPTENPAPQDPSALIRAVLRD